MTLGAPHPGTRWYGAAMLCLFFAVSLVPVWLAKPELRTLLRLFHLHLNPLGFIGLAALGTLPVLLPTALGQPDPQAALFLLGAAGMIAHFAPGVLTGYGAELRKPAGRIHWAASEYATEMHGLMEGAVRSGESVAEQVMNGSA